MKSKLPAAGLGDQQDGGVAKDREEGSRERATLATGTCTGQPEPGAWMRGKRERENL